LDSINRLTVLKLGGSVITIKDRAFTPNKKAINRLSREISEAGVEPLIIVHGGGSFGHVPAHKFQIEKGFHESAQLEGYSKTRQAMMALNKLMVDALIKRGIYVTAVSPVACIITENGRISKFEVEPLEKLLHLGLTPILYGDAVLDKKLGFTILSGDQLISKLAIMFQAIKVVIGIDVDGLYKSDPKINSKAKFISKISLKAIRTFLNGIIGSQNVDVTGGMSGKIAELIPVVERNIPVELVNATVSNRVFKSLRDEKVIGTKIVLE
jgi:isopentenyl phosphate kinase